MRSRGGRNAIKMKGQGEIKYKTQEGVDQPIHKYWPIITFEPYRIYLKPYSTISCSADLKRERIYFSSSMVAKDAYEKMKEV